LSALASFAILDSLVLDYNNIEDDPVLPSMPSLRTLSLNSNNVRNHFLFITLHSFSLSLYHSLSLLLACVRTRAALLFSHIILDSLIMWVQIENLEVFLPLVSKAFPNLTFLSLLKNPACPNELTGKDQDDYRRYRCVPFIQGHNIAGVHSTMSSYQSVLAAMMLTRVCLRCDTGSLWSSVCPPSSSSIRRL
jgi:hypothetical protein